MDKVQQIVQCADKHLAQEIKVMEVHDLTPLADYFIVMHGRNHRQVDAIVTAIIELADEANYPIKSIEGKNEGQWTLIDMNDVIVHVFLQSEREVYSLERIWEDAPRVDISEWVNE